MTDSLSPVAVERAAQLLHAARRDALLLDALPPEFAPRSLEDAYAIQARVVRLAASPVVGWFLGCTNPEVQRQLGIRGPYYGALLEDAVHAGPATVRVPGRLPAVLEVEFAFRLGADLPARAEPYRDDEVAAAVASVHPAIEVVIAHFREWVSQPVWSLIADNGTDGALVYGPATADWRGVDLATLPVTLSVNGHEARRGSGGRIAGGPLSALAWLTNARAASGEGLKAGHIHNTGTCTSLYFAKQGDHAVADFGALGRTEVMLA